MRATTDRAKWVLVLILAGCGGSGGGTESSGSAGSSGAGSSGSSSASGGSGGSATSQAGGTASGGKSSSSVAASGGSVQGGTTASAAGAGGSAGKGGGAGGSSAGNGGTASTVATTGGQGGGTGGGATGGTAGNKGGGTGGSAGATGTGGSTGPVKHRFLKSGHTSQSVAIVAADGSIEWEFKTADETSDSWLLPNGNVVFSFVKGAREVKPDKTVVWEYQAPSGGEVQSCQPLDNDQFLIGEAHGNGTSFLYEMGRDKKINKTITIKTTASNPHDEFRQVRKTPAGTYLVTQQRGGGKAQEYDASGKLLRTFPCGRYVAVRLPDDNTLIACGDDHRLIEVDASDKIVWEVKETDIPGNKLLFVAGLQRLANGNTVIANWSGHAGDPSQPQVFEITRDKKVVWEVKDTKLNMISSIQILDSDALVNGVALR